MGQANNMVGHGKSIEGDPLVAKVVPGSPAHRLLLGCGVVGPILFNLAYLIEGATRTGYDPWRNAVSVLSLGEGGWVQRANFILFGLLVAAMALGLRVALWPGVGATWAPVLSLVVAVGLIIDGIFSQDPVPGYPPGAYLAGRPPSTHAIIHLFGTVLIFTARIAWCFVIARRFAIEPAWRGWANYCVGTALLMMAFMAGFGLSQAVGGPAGLFERLTTGVISLLSLAVALRLLLGNGRVSPASGLQSTGS